MPASSLRIAWLGAGVSYRESGGVPGVATELLLGLARRGHRIDCFAPGARHELPERLAAEHRITFVWGTSEWRWGRWYSRTKISAFASGLVFRGLASLRLRREIARRHRAAPYDVIYQFSNLESLAISARLARQVPVVLHPETHSAGELAFLISERRLALASQPAYTLAMAVSIMALRTLVQRVRIRSGRLLICISEHFREHLVHDYGFPLERTVVVPNPVRLERFSSHERPVGTSPRVLVLGRVAVRKGIEDVVAIAKLLRELDPGARVRIFGGPGIWSDYTRLLDELPSENASYLGRIRPLDVPAELEATDVLLQASRYEPFGLTVGEALAAGVPVVATSEVGAIEGVAESVVAEVAPGDAAGMAAAICELHARLRDNQAELRATARTEAERLFAPDVVCAQISAALERLVRGDGRSSEEERPRLKSGASASEAGDRPTHAE